MLRSTSLLFPLLALGYSVATAQQEQCVAKKMVLRAEDVRVYRVGVLTKNGFEVGYNLYNKTFADYLTMTAGQEFETPIRFEMVPGLLNEIYDVLHPEQVDFSFQNPSIHGCIDMEFESRSLATLVNKRTLDDKTFGLSQFGGVIFTRADNTAVNTLSDLRDKIVGVVRLCSVLLNFTSMIFTHESFCAGHRVPSRPWEEHRCSSENYRTLGSTPSMI
jgi:hypothetical protein